MHLLSTATLSRSERRSPRERGALAPQDGFGILIDHALGLPGVSLVRTPSGPALVLAPDDALGPMDGFLDGTAFARLRPGEIPLLEIVVPLELWRRAMSVGIARPVWARHPAQATRVALLEPPIDAVSAQGLRDLIEASWAYARGL